MIKDSVVMQKNNRFERQTWLSSQHCELGKITSTSMSFNLFVYKMGKLLST